MDQIDPRLIEIEILAEADRAFIRGGSSYEYSRTSTEGPKERQRNAALRGLIEELALVSAEVNYNGSPRPAVPTEPLNHAASVALSYLAGGASILSLRITQPGRLRLFRLRDEILQRDRIRDVAGLWAKVHFIPDLAVRLCMHDPEQPVSLIAISVDIDELTRVNAELGNPGGDPALAGVFETIRDAVQPHETYRCGRQEAVAILPGVALDAATKLGEGIRASIAGRSWDGLPIETRPTISVGVGPYPSPGPMEAEALYSSVAGLVIQARKSGKNKLVSATVPEPATKTA